MIRIYLIIFLVVSVVACGSKPPTDDKPGSGKVESSSKSKNCKKSKKSGSNSSRPRGNRGNGSKDDECEEEIIINVESAKVYRGDAVAVFKTTTILEADQESEVTSKASGIVLEINAEVGDQVKEGDVLAILESDQQKLKLESAEANYQKSLHNYERAQTLLKKGLSNKESVDNLKFETRSLKTNLNQARLELEYTKVKAPISGIITARKIKKGNLIPLNTAVYAIVDFDSLQAVVNVPEDKWSLFKTGLEVQFEFTNFNEMISGHILRIDPIVDSSTGTFRVVIAIDDIDKNIQLGLRPGLFGKTRVVLNKHNNTLLVTKNAVIREDKTAYVYIINEDNTVTKTNIELGYEMDDSLEVISGLSEGQRMVTTGKNNVSAESKVEVIEYND